MNSELIFQEKQRFTQWWLWAITLGVLLANIFLFVKQLLEGVGIKEVLIHNIGMIIPLLLAYLFFIFRLETIVKADGIYVRLFPFHRSYRFFTWDVISKAYVREYNPVKEYGGWGIKGTKKNKALNISGNIGLQIEFKDQSRLLIGTKKAKELNIVLRNLGHKE